MKLPKRDRKLGVGKRMGNAVYVHKSALDAIPGLLERIAERGCGGFDFDVAKLNGENLSLIKCSDFDAEDEPSMKASIVLKGDGTTGHTTYPRRDTWIYHHKWLMVRDDYTGFDVEASKQRSRDWMALDGVDKSRIGRRVYWETQVLPRLK